MNKIPKGYNSYNLFGTGSSAAVALSEILQSELKIDKVVSNNWEHWGTDFFGYQVVPPSPAPRSLTLIATEHASSVAKQMSIMENDFYYIGPFFDYKLFDQYFSGIPEKENFYLLKILRDKDSLEIYNGIKLFRRTGNPVFLKKSNFYQYQHPLFKIKNGDTILDCGSWIGDTQKYFSYFAGDSGYVICFEPDAALSELLPRGNNIKVVNAAVAKESGTGLMNLAQPGSKPGSGGGRVKIKIDESFKNVSQIQLIAIDDLNLSSCDLIKMDIEGAEKSALIGAQNTIKRFKPKLMISIYHLHDDLWRIPKIIEKIAPYEFFLGHHTESAFETVLYCRPAN